MTTTGYGNVLERLLNRELILPIFENQMLSETWPDSYQVKIDSKKHIPRPGYFHPSTHPLMGARELYYRFHPKTKDLIVRERRTMEAHLMLSVHSAYHAIVQEQMVMAGLVSRKNIELSYQNEEHKVRGRIDFIVDHPSIGPIVVEMKGQNPRAFDKQDKLKPEWDAQGSLAADNYGSNHFMLLAFQMGYPFRVKEFYSPKNVELVEKTYEKFDYVRECIENNTPPAHCCDAGSDTMKKCCARFQCWLAPNGHPD